MSRTAWKAPPKAARVYMAPGKSVNVTCRVGRDESVDGIDRPAGPAAFEREGERALTPARLPPAILHDQDVLAPAFDLGRVSADVDLLDLQHDPERRDHVPDVVVAAEILGFQAWPDRLEQLAVLGFEGPDVGI